jgi:hypothetical protein
MAYQTIIRHHLELCNSLKKRFELNVLRLFNTFGPVVAINVAESGADEFVIR